MNKHMLRQAQMLQQRLAQAQEALDQETVQASAGGGVVTVTATGKQRLQAIKIDPSVVDPSDVALLEDLVTAAVNEALEKAQALAAQRLGAIAGGLGLPGLR
ncbi:MAG: YbaB/EbfC family nucleoid-associated protein [Chloroflexi bacterium]|nr:YbaB/EbfC family nucleoid-associated protein [Chloroflexota bacterium]